MRSRYLRQDNVSLALPLKILQNPFKTHYTNSLSRRILSHIGATSEITSPHSLITQFCPHTNNMNSYIRRGDSYHNNITDQGRDKRGCRVCGTYQYSQYMLATLEYTFKTRCLEQFRQAYFALGNLRGFTTQQQLKLVEYA